MDQNAKAFQHFKRKADTRELCFENLIVVKFSNQERLYFVLVIQIRFPNSTLISLHDEAL